MYENLNSMSGLMAAVKDLAERVARLEKELAASKKS